MLREMIGEATAISVISAISARNAGLQILHGKLTSFKVPQKEQKYLGEQKHIGAERHEKYSRWVREVST